MQVRLAAGIVVLLAATAGYAVWAPAAAAAPAVPTEPLARAAAAFLAALDPAQRAVACQPLGTTELERWNFVPGRYAGLELGAMTPPQRELARAVLQALLSTTGLAKVRAIEDLETLLRRTESAQGQDASHRDPDRYALLLLGEPIPGGTFALRYQGHHVSLQAVVQNGVLVGSTPRFLGSNPHAGPLGTRVLGAEEDLARAFLWLLDEAQLAKAVISDTAPADILLGPGVRPAALGARRGVAWRDLSEGQRAVLWRLLEVYAHVLRGPFALDELLRVRAEGLDELSFAWAGSRERGQGHYYRIHGVHFAVEYDCTLGGANHVHTVWRDFTRDSGDLLRRHLEEQHGRK
jgi:hypothetical protein